MICKFKMDYKFIFQGIHQILKFCPNIVALDLRGFKIDFKLIAAIMKNCQKLKCIYLNFITITDSKTWKKMIALGKKFKYLTIDNALTIESIDDFKDGFRMNEFFAEAKELKDLSLTIYPIESRFNYESLSEIGDKVCYIFINVKASEKSYKLKKFNSYSILNNLSQGNGKNIEFLRFISNEEDTRMVWVFQKLGDFNDLIGLNVSSKFYGEQDFTAIAKLKKLKSLTIDFREDHRKPYEPDVEPNQIFHHLLNADFRENLERLKLMDTAMEPQCFRRIAQHFENLEVLQLYDVEFTDIKSSLEYISGIKKLNYLHTEYTFLDETNIMAPLTIPQKLKIFNDFQFRRQYIESIPKFIINCKSLKKLVINEFPGLELTDLVMCQKIAQQNNKIFEFKEFYYRKK